MVEHQSHKPHHVRLCTENGEDKIFEGDINQHSMQQSLSGVDTQPSRPEDVEKGQSGNTTSSDTHSKRGSNEDKKHKYWETLHRYHEKLPAEIKWIYPTVTDWSKMKPVLRSGLAAWICMLFMIISPVERMLGTASFLILIGIFIEPVEVPLAAVIERELFTLLFTSIAWAYACLATFFASLARKNRLPKSETNMLAALNGEYIETGPSAICATFLAVGVAFALYLKVKFGPSPFLFATILACITLDIQ